MEERRAWIIAAALLLWLLTSSVAAQAATGLGGMPRPQPVLELPIPDGSIERLAAIPRPNWKPGHRGIDIAATPGDAVASPGPGAIAFVGEVAGRPVVTVALDMGLTASLEPVTTTLSPGARLEAGQTLGAVADAPDHCPARTCVHLGLRWGEHYVDPLDWLRGFGPIVLLPLGAAELYS